ncbi:MAG: winged helix-turn-helix domain-containing protein [Lysobacterales bacterium]
MPNGIEVAAVWQLGSWQVDASTGEIRGEAGTARLEPKLLDLLRLLIEADGAVVSQAQLLQQLWPGVIVGEDTVARAVSRLRRALGDSARDAQYIETLPKRGYRLISPVRLIEATSSVDGSAAVQPDAPSAPVVPGITRRPGVWSAVGLGVVLAIVIGLAIYGGDPVTESGPTGGAESELLARADDHYGQYHYADNEAALQLYERVLVLRPSHPPALAGLANALVQKAMRWPDGGSGEREFRQLGEALKAGHLREPANARLLARAKGLALQALEQDPDSTIALRAFGLAASAQGDFDAALAAYRHALTVDPDAWGVLINLADVLEITGHPEQALPVFEAAFAAMERAYAREPARIRGWDAALGVLIGDRYRQRGELAKAEHWYRTVLRTTPHHGQATTALAELLRGQGDDDQADALCEALVLFDPKQGCGDPVGE